MKHPHTTSSQPVVREQMNQMQAARELRDHTDAFVSLLSWLHEEAPPSVESRNPDNASHSRFEEFVTLLEADPDMRDVFVGALEALFRGVNATSFFADSGIPEHRGFLSEFWDRFVRKVLPRPRDDRDLTNILARIYRTPAAVERFLRLPPPLFERFIRIVTRDGQSLWTPVEASFADALRIMASRIEAIGLSSPFRRRSKEGPVSLSPFFLLTRVTDTLLTSWATGRELRAALEAWYATASSCSEAVREVRNQLETEGVNLAIVNGLEVIDRSLTRMMLMAEIIGIPPSAERSDAIQGLLRRVVHFSFQDGRIRHLIGWNLDLLNRKIVESAGKTGEHYIATDRRDYSKIWAAAAGGGLVTVFTAAVKLKVTGAGLPLFQEGFLVGLNYAVSFLILQAFGLILATKQPAMTAATLGAIIRERRGESRYDEIIDYLAHITSSQMAAAVANVMVVFVGAVGFEFLWRWLTGVAYLAEPNAQYVFESLSPVNSGTVFYAALTGVILWLASLAGGWFHNFIMYNRVPEGVESMALGGFAGHDRMKRLGGFVARNCSGWGTNVSLGFMLGFTPVIGGFLGAPLDIRHVTLSSGMLALAGAALDEYAFGGTWLLLGFAGIATMFVLNLGVSFLLALWNSGRAYEFGAADLRHLFGRFVRRFRQNPGAFFLPPPPTAAGRETARKSRHS